MSEVGSDESAEINAELLLFTCDLCKFVKNDPTQKPKCVACDHQGGIMK